MINYYLNRSEYFKNFVRLFTGTAIAQAISFLFNIVIARLYLPDDFGQLAYLVAVVTFLLVFANGKLDLAMVSATSDRTARALGILSLQIASLFTLLLIAFNAVATWVGVTNPAFSAFGEMGWVVPLLVFVFAVLQVLIMWNVREKKFKTISIVRVVEALSIGLVSVALFKMKAWGLVAGVVAGQCLTLIALKASTKGLFSGERAGDSWQSLIKQFAEFPKVNIAQGLLDMFQLSAVILFFTHFGALHTVGLFAMCVKVLQAPLRLISAPMANVFFSEAAAFQKEGKSIHYLTKSTVKKVAIALLPIPLLLIVAGPWLFGFVLGGQWVEAGHYAQIVTIWFYADMIRVPVSQVAVVKNKQRLLLFYNIAGSLLLGITLVGGHVAGLDVMNILLLTAIGQTLFLTILVRKLIAIAR